MPQLSAADAKEISNLFGKEVGKQFSAMVKNLDSLEKEMKKSEKKDEEKSREQELIDKTEKNLQKQNLYFQSKMKMVTSQ